MLLFENDGTLPLIAEDNGKFVKNSIERESVLCYLFSIRHVLVHYGKVSKQQSGCRQNLTKWGNAGEEKDG